MFLSYSFLSSSSKGFFLYTGRCKYRQGATLRESWTGIGYHLFEFLHYHGLCNGATCNFTIKAKIMLTTTKATNNNNTLHNFRQGNVAFCSTKYDYCEMLRNVWLLHSHGWGFRHYLALNLQFFFGQPQTERSVKLNHQSIECQKIQKLLRQLRMTLSYDRNVVKEFGMWMNVKVWIDYIKLLNGLILEVKKFKCEQIDWSWTWTAIFVNWNIDVECESMYW